MSVSVNRLGYDVLRASLFLVSLVHPYNEPNLGRISFSFGCAWCFVLRMGRKVVGPVCCVLRTWAQGGNLIKKAGVHPCCSWFDWLHIDPLIRCSVKGVRAYNPGQHLGPPIRNGQQTFPSDNEHSLRGLPVNVDGSADRAMRTEQGWHRGLGAGAQRLAGFLVS